MGDSKSTNAARWLESQGVTFTSGDEDLPYGRAASYAIASDDDTLELDDSIMPQDGEQTPGALIDAIFSTIIERLIIVEKELDDIRQQLGATKNGKSKGKTNRN